MIKSFIDCVSFFFPIKKHVVFIDCFHGQYNDNPKYIISKFHAKHPDFKIVLGLSKMHGNDYVPDYITTVPVNSIRYSFYKNTAAIVIDNYTGIFGLKINTLHEKKKRFLYSIRKKMLKSKQIRISTWHGTPLKHVGVDVINEELRSKYQYMYATDYMIAGSKYEADVFSRAFGITNIFVFGNARNDILFWPPEKTSELKDKINVPEGAKVLLIAPTYRDNVEGGGIDYLKTLDIPQILLTLKNKFGGDWVAILRVHQNTFRWLMSKMNDRQLPDYLIDGNKFDDMAIYLSTCDALITDYSGSIFDIALTDKPCFLFTPDLDDYRANRGLYIDIESLPYDYAKDQKTLIGNIESYDNIAQENRRNCFNLKTGNVNDGHASARIVSFIEEQIELKRKHVLNK